MCSWFKKKNFTRLECYILEEIADWLYISIINKLAILVAEPMTPLSKSNHPKLHNSKDKLLS
uniref:Putative ovule protein n=1 Tax=Solanum chacoense TaxID=4108 RepID=A0A0V0GYD1_SOLCH